MMIVRRLLPNDAEACRALRLEALHRHPEAFGSGHAEECFRPLSSFADRIAGGYIAGGFADGQLDAMAGLLIPTQAKSRHKGMLWGVYARENRRGSGLADAVMTALLAHAAEHVEQIHLSVAATNERAIGFYERLGFEPYGTEPRALKVDGVYIDELLMVKFMR
ncbi:acyl-CoA acyltransferase [Azospirillum sp. TSH100]|uniref:GNAT family N-acetyltransferase n=1 Tax=Azospirillum sp. TSH100 TaxID=652764 RepID=UPI000D61C8F3|nr:GNAT family N-acetyltransferase [Azospirillum sp. TSH100]PWC81608.1 acyl-CoA acyltransferase [Azospirillum sp. TSH100]QCG91246.1 GNAT family N-acetyltransferase [Azospirillum sp. TSH100]